MASTKSLGKRFWTRYRPDAQSSLASSTCSTHVKAPVSCRWATRRRCFRAGKACAWAGPWVHSDSTLPCRRWAPGGARESESAKRFARGARHYRRRDVRQLLLDCQTITRLPWRAFRALRSNFDDMRTDARDQLGLWHVFNRRTSPERGENVHPRCTRNHYLLKFKCRVHQEPQSSKT
jgi:hypothetical protein